MKDIYLINWWTPEDFQRQSRFYAANQKINKKTLEACASVSALENYRNLFEGVEQFEQKGSKRFGLIELNIKPTHDSSKMPEEIQEHYKNFIPKQNIIDIQVGRPPMND